VIVVGSLTNASQIAADLLKSPEAGYWVVGACISTGETEDTLPGTRIPILGNVDMLLAAVTATDADTVLVVGGHNLSPRRMRQLSWSLEPGKKHLVMAPSLTDIAGPRIHSRPVAGLPLIHVETPRYEGVDRFAKRAFDVIASGGLLLVLSLPLAIVGLIVATTSPGGVFFAHERIGKGGEPFRMLKFRSMVADADSRLAALLASQGTSDKPLFKIENDPRITRVGAFIRRYSIDEVPQLINVLRGDMSLVGPRPQVAKEVALYDHAAARRLFVKPGMTGLWQVSGRSNLDWDQSVRLDLFYVENWSLTSDIVILAKTVRAVLASDGAV
jgi:exopolysaccharide biosynthesis polyprenyl glycosylphosphotransferase